jgi:hypothetical protein
MNRGHGIKEKVMWEGMGMRLRERQKVQIKLVCGGGGRTQLISNK